MTPRRGRALAGLLAVAWAVLPAAPALWRGQLLGHDRTDLYTQVWAAWWFASAQPGLPLHTDLLGAPDGVPFYVTAPLQGWCFAVLEPAFGLVAAWDGGVVVGRALTVLCAYGAARAWRLGPAGALVAAAVYGTSPYFQGFAVEGIAEGVHGWPLALLAWALAPGRRGVLAGLALALTALGSWYAGAAGCVLALACGRRGLVALSVGALGIVPLAAAFFHTLPEHTPLDPAVRRAMGLQATLRPPGWTTGLQPFAQTSWIGLTAGVLALASARRRPVAVAAALGLLVLSVGAGPWYELPGLASLRFPYRLHAGTLAAVALLAGTTADGLRRGAWLAPLIALEGLLLAPVEPVLPGTDPTVSPVVLQLADRPGALMDLPGPRRFPPGEADPTRRRTRYLLYHQAFHGRASVWVPAFNAVGVPETSLPGAWADFDRLAPTPAPALPPVPPAVSTVVLHQRELGLELVRRADAHLREEGWTLAADADGLRVYER